MDVSLELLVLALCVLASALYSGSEIGFYSLSPVQVDLEARQGGRTARIVRLLMQDDSALLITILIGNNLALELATLAGDSLLEAGPGTRGALLVSAVLTPILFLFGEALPKDIFRRRPHALIGLGAQFLLLSRIVFWPLERLLWLVSRGLERLLGLKTGVVAQVRGAETVRAFFEAGRQSGALTERASVLAHNALQMRSTPIERAMVPWENVLHLSEEASLEDQVAIVRRSRFSRLPVVTPSGAVQGYVHQMDVLFGGGTTAPLDKLRPVLALTADTPVDRALQTLRGGGHRVAVVGELAAPVGWVTLKDLVEEISGDLVGL
jgi:CBS domain containing-hemolysin-like protein